MFFMMGITDERRELDFAQMTVCKACGAYGRYRVFMTCTLLSLFFIPCLKWNKKYFVQSSCCGALYELSGEAGVRIARGEDVQIRPEDLTPLRAGCAVRRCASCGYATDQDFDFCPKCGRRF